MQDTSARGSTQTMGRPPVNSRVCCRAHSVGSPSMVLCLHVLTRLITLMTSEKLRGVLSDTAKAGLVDRVMIAFMHDWEHELKAAQEATRPSNTIRATCPLPLPRQRSQQWAIESRSGNPASFPFFSGSKPGYSLP